MHLSRSHPTPRQLAIPCGKVQLHCDVAVPPGIRGLIIFAHGSGSSRYSPRNQAVARVLQADGFATALFDLLTPEEEQREFYTRHLRFDIGLLAERLIGVTEWLAQQSVGAHKQLGFFGASTGAAAALVAAAHLGDKIRAIVSRGGRPDLAGDALEKVTAPTLLIVGGRDAPVIELNEQARKRLRCEKILTIVPGASHLFEEPGALEKVSRLAAEWFLKHVYPPDNPK